MLPRTKNSRKRKKERYITFSDASWIEGGGSLSFLAPKTLLIFTRNNNKKLLIKFLKENKDKNWKRQSFSCSLRNKDFVTFVLFYFYSVKRKLLWVCRRDVLHGFGFCLVFDVALFDWLSWLIVQWWCAMSCWLGSFIFINLPWTKWYKYNYLKKNTFFFKKLYQYKLIKLF